MSQRVKYLVQIVPHLEERYGTAGAQAIVQRAVARYEELLEENADEPKAYHMHTRERIYPAIAAFEAMLAEGIERAEASDFLVGYYTWRAESMAAMVKCPYMDICVRYGCPEIVRGFCDADDVCYGNMHPKLSWERTKTLGHGHDCCNFKIRILEG